MDTAIPVPRTALSLAAGLWTGLVCGVSFVATPAKFLTPNLPAPLAFDIGRYVFHASSAVQWGFAVLVIILVAAARPGRATVLAASVAVLSLALQSFWLLPVLDHRIDLLLAGRPAPASIHHSVFAVVEVAKVLALLLLAWRSARALRPIPTPAAVAVA